MRNTFLLAMTIAITNNSISQNGNGLNYPYAALYELRNCSKDLRTATFDGQVGFLTWCVNGHVKVDENRVMVFSKDYRMDTALLTNGVNAIKKTLPKSFWDAGMLIQTYDNEPNEKAIWFIRIFAQVEKGDKIKILSAYKITFEGNDARNDAQRRDPKIKNIEFILEKAELEKLEKQLKSSSKTFPNS